MSDQLVEIKPSDLPALRDLYLVNWPDHMIGYYNIDNFIRWFDKQPRINHLTFYSLNGDWRNDGTFIAIGRYERFVNSLSASNEKIARLLNLLDWSRGYKVSSFRKKYRPELVAAIEARNLSCEFDGETNVYYMPRDEAARLTVDVPDGMKLGQLTDSHVKIADEAWPNRHRGSLFLLRRLANWNVNVGLFSKEGNLIAWCFRFQTGMLGAIQVDRDHMGKGYGSLVCRAITKKLGEMGEDVYANVGATNVPSNKLFSRIGFNVVDTTHWLQTIPTIPFEWRDDDESHDLND